MLSHIFGEGFPPMLQPNSTHNTINWIVCAFYCVFYSRIIIRHTYERIFQCAVGVEILRLTVHIDIIQKYVKRRTERAKDPIVCVFYKRVLACLLAGVCVYVCRWACTCVCVCECRLCSECDECVSKFENRNTDDTAEFMWFE